MNRLTDLLTRKKVICISYPYIMFSQRDNQKLVYKIANKGADLIEIFVTTPDMLSKYNQRFDILKFLNKRKYQQNILFDLVGAIKDIRKKSNCPIIVKSDTNTFLDYGLKEFFVDASDAGVDGLHVLDLPPEESKDFFYFAKSYGIELIFSVDSGTQSERLANIIAASGSIVYFTSDSIELEKSEENINRIKQQKNELNVIYIDPSEEDVSVLKYSDGILLSDQVIEELKSSKRRLFKMIINQRKRLVENGIL